MSREAFDTAMAALPPEQRYGLGAQLAWPIWQAARAAALEEAARKVENYCGAWDDEGYALAMEIRALKEKE